MSLYRIAGCGSCLKYNKVPIGVWVYRCGHCGTRIDGTPEEKVRMAQGSNGPGHTPIPWYALGTDIKAVGDGGPDSPYTVAKCWSSTFAPERRIAAANAKLIAKAVNAHGDLLAACEEALKAVDEAYQTTGYLKIAETSDQRLRIEAAIAKAKGTPP